MILKKMSWKYLISDIKNTALYLANIHLLNSMSSENIAVKKPEYIYGLGWRKNI